MHIKGNRGIIDFVVRCRHSLRQFSCLLGKKRKLYIKNVSDAFRKTPVHSASGRHHDDRWQNAPGVFRRASEAFFIISYLYRFLPTSHGYCRSLLYPCYVKLIYMKFHLFPHVMLYYQSCTQFRAWRDAELLGVSTGSKLCTTLIIFHSVFKRISTVTVR